ncbi:uroporphyrinogen-III C-methyltransferase [Vibrio misgurnus]|uniref:uroporphyrinogen-III C-methyltransferase n=1 Tax=Vibrio misgurnus TaxID=2993714 RepID=UPI0023F87502|nr:uroporphyrinogen-III C-methyltransferase [Vibrio sp. VCS]
MTDQHKPQQEPATTNTNPKSPTPVSSTASSVSDTAAKPASAKAAPANQSGKKLATLALVLVLALGAGLAYLHQQQTSKWQSELQALRAELQQTRSDLTAELEQAQASTTSQTTALAQRTETELEQQQQSLASLQLTLADIQGRRPNDWLLAEADYLVKLAGRKLFIEQDVTSATQLIQTADQRIATLNDPSLTPLRKAFANDITTLKSIPIIDRDGLVLRLISLQQQVASLPLANAMLPTEQPPLASQAVSEDITDWQTNLRRSLTAFAGHFITFRSRDGNAIPLLAPSQHFYLQENLKAKLETAIKAVYAQQQAIYHTSLTTAAQWSSAFFNAEDPALQAFNRTLEQLAKLQVQVEYPVKLQSQQPLSEAINQRLRRSVAPLTTEQQP